MSITFSCANCGQQLEADGVGAGCQVQCPACDARITVPSEKEAVLESDLRCLESTAKAGDAEAQYQLGISFLSGSRVPASEPQAVQWFQRAAEQGHAKAQYELGHCCQYGKGLPRNTAEAVKWYRRASPHFLAAAEQGDAEAQYIIAVMCNSGHGMNRNLTEAAKWYEKAARQGRTHAQYKLGELYCRGSGHSRDPRRGAYWYHIAAKQGYGLASAGLGRLYAEGLGLVQDFVEAYKWFNLGAAQGDKDAITERDRIVSRMTPEQIAEGQRRAAEFVAETETLCETEAVTDPADEDSDPTTNAQATQVMNTDFTHLIERLDAFEERLGVSLAGLYATAAEDDWANMVSVNGELHPANGTGLEKNLEIVADIVDGHGRMVGTQAQPFSRDDFFGFETFSLYIPIHVPLVQIHKIRLYPKELRY